MKKRLEFLNLKDKPIFEIKDVSKSFDGRYIKKTFNKSFPGEALVF